MLAERMTVLPQATDVFAAVGHKGINDARLLSR
jgi:hypothetical protein